MERKMIYLDDALETIRKLPNAGIRWFVSAEAVFNALLKLPSAHPEWKKGKWISHYDYCKKHELLPSGLVVFWWCDQCEQGVEHPTNFCPNCGADMREVSE